MPRATVLSSPFPTPVRLRAWLLGLVSLVLFALCGAGEAAGLKDLRRPYTHTSQNEPLTVLLSDFAVSQGCNAAFTSRVEGVVSGAFAAMPPRAFLASMRSSHGVEAYRLGSTLHFFHQSERRREVLHIASMPPAEMRRALLRMNALSEDLPSDASQKEQLLFIEGPEGYVSGLVTSIRLMEEMRMQESAIRVFPLKHAWADDTRIETATGTTQVPGVASVLRAIAGAQGAPAARVLHRSANTPSLMGTGLSSREEAQAPAEGAPEARGGGSGPSIIAEPRSNSVVVSDRSHRMPYYEAVIAELDKPLDLVEIHAAIVDINTDYAYNLGINWGGGRNEGGGRFGGSSASLGAPESSLGAAGGAGLALTTLYNTTLNSFFSRISALEERGDGAVLSRPSVLTVDNVQASLEYTTTFYVKLEGYQTVDMVPVTSGTTLKVTPRILRMPDGKPSRLAMTITIADGADPLAVNKESWVGGVPPVKKVTINTQAMVAEGQSLLLGGFYYERRSDGRAGVPGVMNIPVLGSLFRKTDEAAQRMERLILITPRIISYDALGTPPPARLEEPPFALSPTKGGYELKENSSEIVPRAQGGCSSIRPGLAPAP